MQVAFEGSITDTQHNVLGKKLDLCFPEHKLAIEIDEYGNVYRDYQHEQCRQLMIQKKIGCTFIRIDPDAADFSINKVINLVHKHIIKSSN